MSPECYKQKGLGRSTLDRLDHLDGPGPTDEVMKAEPGPGARADAFRKSVHRHSPICQMPGTEAALQGLCEENRNSLEDTVTEGLSTPKYNGQWNLPIERLRAAEDLALETSRRQPPLASVIS
ncbi:hypothetical protein CB1_056579011 [Camelus ferus]|nr:hypothetical protein CB1_056579011 [Camelus ferus]